MQGLKHGNMTKYNKNINKTPFMYKVALEGCVGFDNVTDAISMEQNRERDYFQQEGWMTRVADNIEANQHSIDGYQQQMTQAWFGGKYYEAGKLQGLINALIFA